MDGLLDAIGEDPSMGCSDCTLPLRCAAPLQAASRTLCHGVLQQVALAPSMHEHLGK